MFTSCDDLASETTSVSVLSQFSSASHTYKFVKELRTALRVVALLCAVRSHTKTQPCFSILRNLHSSSVAQLHVALTDDVSRATPFQRLQMCLKYFHTCRFSRTVCDVALSSPVLHANTTVVYTFLQPQHSSFHGTLDRTAVCPYHTLRNIFTKTRLSSSFKQDSCTLRPTSS